MQHSSTPVRKSYRVSRIYLMLMFFGAGYGTAKVFPWTGPIHLDDIALLALTIGGWSLYGLLVFVVEKAVQESELE